MLTPFYIGRAIRLLAPSAVANVTGMGYSDIEWKSDDIPMPTELEIMSLAERLAVEDTYQRLRAAEYPPMSDYLDGVVKGDTAQVQKYIDECLAVKAKYPKGTS